MKACKAYVMDVQCTGGFPCHVCIRTGQECILPRAKEPTISLERAVGSTSNGRCTHLLAGRRSVVPWSILADLPSRYITHFYSSFLSSNNICGTSDAFRDVHCLLLDSPGLYKTAIAVSALHVQAQSLTTSGLAKATAVQFYRAAISSVRNELADPELCTNDSILWSTFFLGYFEVGHTSRNRHIYHEPVTEGYLLSCSVDVRRLRRRLDKALPPRNITTTASPWPEPTLHWSGQEILPHCAHTRDITCSHLLQRDISGTEGVERFDAQDVGRGWSE